MKSIFVNIFGGIARCDHIAEAVVAGVKAVGGNAAIKPLVIRLEGQRFSKSRGLTSGSAVCVCSREDPTAGHLEGKVIGEGSHMSVQQQALQSLAAKKAEIYIIIWLIQF